MTARYTPEELRGLFFSQIDYTSSERGCFLWTGTLTDRGYAHFHIDGHHVKGHSFAYEFAFGDIPDGLCLLHECDVPRCVNPNHLTPGTQVENAKDRNIKGRTARGTQIPSAVITEQQALEVMHKYFGEAVPRRMLALEYGVSMDVIGGIVRGETWKHVTLPIFRFYEDNPQLKLGTLARQVGERHYATHLSSEQVIAIRAEFRTGVSERDLARRYGVHYSTVRHIVHGRTWKHLMA